MNPNLVRYNKKLRRWSKRIYKSLFFPPTVIFVAMLLVTYWSYRAATVGIQRDQTIAIDNRKETVSATINQRLSTYEEILIGGSGLFKASSDVTEVEWNEYISTYAIAERYPGVQVIGYLKVVTPDQVPALADYMAKQGFSGFKIRPEGHRDLYTALLYTQPARQSSVIGLDLYTEQNRRTTLDRARDGGLVSLTQPIKSIQGTTNQLVFSMFAPQYKRGLPTATVEQRRAAIEGFIYAGFRSEDFFNKLLPANLQDQGFGIRISATDSNTKTTFYESANYGLIANGKSRVASSQKIELYGQTWNIDYVFTASSLSSVRRRNGPLWTIVAGSLFAILLAEVIYLLLKSRAQDLTKQRDRAVDLAKDELLSLASHQLRTPATTVKQYLGMVLQGFAGDVSTTQQSLLEKAYAGNERQLFIINEMLHVAKIDSGRITLAKQRTNLNKLLETIVKDSTGEAQSTGHTLRLKLPKKAIWLNVDEHMLRMSIENLISNAVKYTVKPGTVDIWLIRKDHRIYIHIKDKGIGIAQKDFPKLYKLFSRLNNKQTQTVSGTGIGLYLAKHFVELHDGAITLESDVGKGSTFSIILPDKNSNQP